MTGRLETLVQQVNDWLMEHGAEVPQLPQMSVSGLAMISWSDTPTEAIVALPPVEDRWLFISEDAAHPFFRNAPVVTPDEWEAGLRRSVQGAEHVFVRSVRRVRPDKVFDRGKPDYIRVRLTVVLPPEDNPQEVR